MSGIDIDDLPGRALRLLQTTLGLRRHSTESSKGRLRVAMHALLLTLIIASFWTLDSLKDPVFEATVGMRFQPGAKLWSVITTLIVVCIYDALTGLVEKQWLFHVVSVLFGLIFFIISALMYNVTNNMNSDNTKGKVQGDYCFVGYLTYFAIESYGSLMVAMFWSFTNNLMRLEEAKDVYGVIISCAQIGAVLGSTIATRAQSWGIPNLFLLASIGVFCISLFMKIYFLAFEKDYSSDAIRGRLRTMSDDLYYYDNYRCESYDNTSTNSPSQCINTSENQSPISKSDREYISPDGNSGKHNNNNSNDQWSLYHSCGRFVGGFYEGLKIVLSHKYVFILFIVSTLHEVVLTILDYQFKLMGVIHVSKPGNYYDFDVEGNNIGVNGNADESAFANLMGHFGQLTNLMSFIISFFGFSYLVRRYGVPNTILIFPCLLCCCVLINSFVTSLWLLFAVVSIIKALVFSLFDPVKELLYMPTTEDVKFKAKAWIDVFGARFAKAIGSLFTSAAHGSVQSLRDKTEVFVFVCSLGLLFAAYYVGQEFDRLTYRHEVVGDYNQEEKAKKENEIKTKSSSLSIHGSVELPERRGLRPGDVGYDGYDLRLFEGVFEDECDDPNKKGSEDIEAKGRNNL